MNYLTQALREHQELAVFLTLAIGFFIGRLKIGTFSLGTAVGCLLAGVAIGQMNIQVPAVVKYVFFDLFLFTTGYKVGPQFFRALKKDALPQLAITLVLCLTCLSPRIPLRNSSVTTWARQLACCRRIHRIDRHRNRERCHQSRGHHTGRGQNGPDQ
jgi:Predicted permease